VPATACDTCSMTICTACWPEGRDFVCIECRAQPVDMHTQGASSSSSASRNWGPELVVPSPVEVKTVVGLKVIRATLGVPAMAYFAASPLRQARMAITASVPEGSARARLGAWQRFCRFLVVIKTAVSMISVEDVADYVVWRAAPPSGGFSHITPVRAATVMGDLSHIRGYAYDTGAIDPTCLYGRPISLVLKRLGGSDKHDSVRKTPVEIEVVERSVRLAERSNAADSDIMMAVLLTFGVFFFLRCGECGFTGGDVAATGTDITLTWTLQKTRSRLVPTRMSRTCGSPLLLRAWTVYMRRWPKRNPSESILWHEGTPITAGRVQTILQGHLGAPPVLPGEQRALPWSLRAGGATLCFTKGMATDRIMRLGRWTSEVSLMYCVLTPGVQAAAWHAVDVALAYRVEPQGV
jgi:hypothetical protein